VKIPKQSDIGQHFLVHKLEHHVHPLNDHSSTCLLFLSIWVVQMMVTEGTQNSGEKKVEQNEGKQ